MKRGHSKILEVLVVPNKTNKTGMSLTMPQVCVIYIYIFFFLTTGKCVTLIAFIIIDIQRQAQKYYVNVMHECIRLKQDHFLVK